MSPFQSRFGRPKVKCQCAHCGKEFMRWPSQIELSKTGLLFCSNACRSDYFSMQRSRSDVQCAYCGKLFHRSSSEIARSNKTHAYCSRECYDKARQEEIAERHRPVGRGGRHPVQCEHCGKTFYVKPSILNAFRKKFCSMECKRLHSITSGAFIPRDYLKQRGQRCEICGIEDPDILEVHHKDRNRKNNDLNNLMLVCANCHAKLHRGLIQLE